MPACRACHSNLEPFIDFGRMPLANGFLAPDQFAADMDDFNWSAAYCLRCTLVQLVEQPPRERMFNERYPFFSATSARMQEHFARLAETSCDAAARDPFVVEIGSNDGTLLRHVARPASATLASSRRERGRVRPRPRRQHHQRFFDAGLARRIVAEHGHAHAIVAANAMSHIADLHWRRRGRRQPAGARRPVRHRGSVSGRHRRR